jgi:hypothetical protein
MTLSIPTALLLAVVLAQSPGTQNKPDFSGRWILLSVESDEPDAPPLRPKAAAELTIVQSAAAVRIDHPAGQGATHPGSGSRRFLVSGVVGTAGQRSSSVGWFGRQLVITESIISPADAKGERITYEYGEIWTLEGDDQLVIEFSLRQSAKASESGRLTYRRRIDVTPRAAQRADPPASPAGREPRTRLSR